LSKASYFTRGSEKLKSLLGCVFASLIQARAKTQAVSHCLRNVETRLKYRVTLNMIINVDQAVLEYIISQVPSVFPVPFIIQLLHTYQSPFLELCVSPGQSECYSFVFTLGSSYLMQHFGCLASFCVVFI
jgi:hypothetical protein